jgi:hypothetical protein
MALGPGDWDSQLVTGASNGEIKLMDFRVGTGGAGGAGEASSPKDAAAAARMGVWKTVKTEDKGILSAFSAHPYAPLLATASYSQSSQAGRRMLPALPSVPFLSRADRYLIGSSFAVCWPGACR